MVKVRKYKSKEFLTAKPITENIKRAFGSPPLAFDWIGSQR